MMGFKKLIRELHLKRRINRVTQLLFSDTLLTETQDEQDMFVRKVCSTMDQKKLLLTYICIQFVATDVSFKKSYPPITKKQIKDLLNELDRIDKYFYDAEFVKLTLNFHKLKAYRNLRLATYYFKRGREAFQTNNLSFEGLRYAREKNSNRPLTLAEYNNAKESAVAIYELDVDIKELENKYESHLGSLRAGEVVDNIRRELDKIDSLIHEQTKV
jgi:hypothetical protein